METIFKPTSQIIRHFRRRFWFWNKLSSRQTRFTPRHNWSASRKWEKVERWMALFHLCGRFEIEKLFCKSTYYDPWKADSSLCYMQSSRLHRLCTFSETLFFFFLGTDGHLAVLIKRRRRLIPSFVFLNSLRQPYLHLLHVGILDLWTLSQASVRHIVTFLGTYIELSYSFLKIPFLKKESWFWSSTFLQSISVMKKI